MDNFKTFLRYLLPGVDEDVASNIDPKLIRRFDQLLEADGLSVEEAIANLDWPTKTVNLPEVIHLSKSEMSRGSRPNVFSNSFQSPITSETEPPAPSRFDFTLLATASLVLATVMAGAVASSNMKKKYEELMDSASGGLSSAEWEDDAPDKDDVIPFYDTGTIDALIAGFNSMRAKAAAYLKEYTKESPNSGYEEISFEDHQKRIRENPELSLVHYAEQEGGDKVPRKEQRAREAIAEAEAAAATNVKHDTWGINPKSLFGSLDVIDNVAGGLASLAGMSTAAYLHYKSILDKPVPPPPPLQFGTAVPPDLNRGNETVVEEADLAADFLNTAKEFYNMYDKHVSETRKQKEKDAPPLPTAEAVVDKPLDTESPADGILPDTATLAKLAGMSANAYMQYQAGVGGGAAAAVLSNLANIDALGGGKTVPVIDETTPEVPQNDVATPVLTETAPPETPPTAMEAATEELQEEAETAPPTVATQEEAETAPPTVATPETRETEYPSPDYESSVSDSIISKYIEPRLEKILAKGLSATRVKAIAPILSSIVASVIADNKTVGVATSTALLETAVARGLNKIMPTSFAAKLAPPFIAALNEAVRINATMGSVANSAIEAAFLPVMTVLLTGALTPTLGFAMSSVTATVGARFAYDAVKGAADVTLDVMQQVEEIRKELKKEEEERAAKRMKTEPVEPSLRTMINMSDDVLVENILTNLENETNESRQLPQPQVETSELEQTQADTAKQDQAQASRGSESEPERYREIRQELKEKEEEQAAKRIKI